MSEGSTATEEQVLVVDDELWVCNIVSEVLRSEGYNPIQSTSPEDALILARQKPFALAFLDIQMPGMNGMELAAFIKMRQPKCEIVFMTGYGTIDNAVQAIKIGAYDYLRKPFSISELRFCLKRFQERQALKQQVSLAEQRYFHLVQNIPLLIFVLRPDFELDFVNQACLSMLGFTPEEAMSTPGWFLDRLYPEDRDRIQKMFQTAFDSGKSSVSTECRLLHKNDYLIYTFIKSISLNGPDAGVPLNHLEGIIVDISDRIFLEKALVQKEKLNTLGAISAEVAHEIRNPLVSLGGFARRLQKKFPDSYETLIILRECERLERILDRIRNYLKPVELLPRECSVNQILNDCIDLLSPEIDRQQVRCRLHLDQKLPTTHADPEILGQIFINLIRNALAAMDKGGELHIRTFESTQNIHVDFRNPIRTSKPPINAEHLFLPFDEGGQSIGLPLCYRLLKNMGGILSFTTKSNAVIFTVSLPKTGPVLTE